MAYGIDSWTPETWYRALLLLPLDSATKSDLSAAFQEMGAWRLWINLYQMVGSVVMWWTGMVYLREWKRVCGFGFGSGSNHAIEEVVTYRVGYAGEGGRK